MVVRLLDENSAYTTIYTILCPKLPTASARHNVRPLTQPRKGFKRAVKAQYQRPCIPTYLSIPKHRPAGSPLYNTSQSTSLFSGMVLFISNYPTSQQCRPRSTSCSHIINSYIRVSASTGLKQQVSIRHSQTKLGKGYMFGKGPPICTLPNKPGLVVCDNH